MALRNSAQWSITEPMLRRLRPAHRLNAAILTVLLAFVVATDAHAAPHVPEPGKVFYGLTDGDSFTDFEQRTGKRPAVWQQWLQWDGSMEYAFTRARQGRTRLMLHISTAAGQNAAGRISPGEIARGKGDDYLLRLGRRLAEHGAPVYLRILGEMNNCDNAYASHDCNGRRRDADHAAGRFKQAWKRMVLILRGGTVAEIDARLNGLGMPPVDTHDATLQAPQVAFVWSPMTGGSPMIPALRPQVFWPGAKWVDWVGTSFYSRFPNFHFLEPFYKQFAVRYRKPFAFAEWAIWGADNPSFVKRLFAWTKSHKRTRMMLYNQGKNPVGPFRLRHFPRAEQALRNAARSPRYLPLAFEHRR